MNGHIVAIGGGTFLTDDPDPRLDAFILGLDRQARARTSAYLGTASGDHDRGSLRASTARCALHDCEPTELTFFERMVEDLEAFVAEQDVFWVAGGSTANLLAVWRLHGLDVLLRDGVRARARCCAASPRG